MENGNAHPSPEHGKSRGPLVATVVVLAVLLAGAVAAFAFLAGRESATEADSVEATTSTTLGEEEIAGLSEEELAALIDGTMAQIDAAVVALEQAAATYDSTDDETETVEVVVSAENVDELVAYAESLLAYYTATYGEYAGTATGELAAVQTELDAISTTTDEILALLEGGASAASDASAQLQAKVAALTSSSGALQGASEEWQSRIGTAREQLGTIERPDVTAPDVSAPDAQSPTRPTRAN